MLKQSPSIVQAKPLLDVQRCSFRCLPIAALLVYLGPVASAAPPADVTTAVLPLLEESCLRCHNSKKASGAVDFSRISDQASAKAQYRLWKKAREQIRSEAMPPNHPLEAAEVETFERWFQATFDTRHRPEPGPPLLRQLTRDEYAQTLRDLLRINFDAAAEAGIPAESTVEGYPNRAGGLVLEASLIEKYFTATELALDRLFQEPGAKKALLGSIEGQPATAAAIRQVLKPFLRRAFRRPVTDAEVERYAAVADTSLQAAEPFPVAIRKALKPILLSPHFLLRVEKSPEKPGTIHRISDHELAVRLSYFLWGTMPDPVLDDLADRGQLSDPVQLRAQVRRMLADDRARALTSRFLSHWLQLDHLRKALPTQNHYPTFTRSLRDAMERESWLFCDHIRKEDRIILEFLNADYTFVNEELAKHYQLPGVTGPEFRKVSLRPGDHRGGIITMASILTMTSHTDRTKPTARGKWILEVLLGAPPPPPPANVGNFAPPAKDQPEPKNFREKLALHASNPNCVGCHKRIDPLGFALENYDAIGRWRDALGDEPVDNRGTLPGIGEFHGIDGLRTVLRTKQDQFVENLVAQALTYALGRDLSYYDEPTIADTVAALRNNNYRFSTMIEGIVLSYPFLHRQAE